MQRETKKMWKQMETITVWWDNYPHDQAMKVPLRAAEILNFRDGQHIPQRDFYPVFLKVIEYNLELLNATS